MINGRRHSRTIGISFAIEWWNFWEGVHQIALARKKALLDHCLGEAYLLSPKPREIITEAFYPCNAKGFWQPTISSNFDVSDIDSLFKPIFEQLEIATTVGPPSFSGHLAGVVHYLTDGQFLARECRLYADVVCKLDHRHRELVIVKEPRDLQQLWSDILPPAVKASGADCSMQDAFHGVVRVCKRLDVVFSTFHVLTTQYDRVIELQRQRGNQK